MGFSMLYQAKHPEIEIDLSSVRWPTRTAPKWVKRAMAENGITAKQYNYRQGEAGKIAINFYNPSCQVLLD